MGIDATRMAAARVEARALAQPPELPSTFRELRSQILKCLVSASDAEVLRTAQHELMQLLKMHQEYRPDSATVATLLGGSTFDKGQEGNEFFYRRDGARISFCVTVIFRNGVCTLLAYRFHLQFPAGTTYYACLRSI